MPEVKTQVREGLYRDAFYCVTCPKTLTALEACLAQHCPVSVSLTASREQGPSTVWKRPSAVRAEQSRAEWMPSLACSRLLLHRDLCIGTCASRPVHRDLCTRLPLPVVWSNPEKSSSRGRGLIWVPLRGRGHDAQRPQFQQLLTSSPVLGALRVLSPLHSPGSPGQGTVPPTLKMGLVTCPQ